MREKRFIEMDFPIKVVSEESSREKNIRHGHISTLHIWWARRPLASSRASIYAALTPEPKDEEERLKKAQFIGRLSRWENSLNSRLIEKAKKEILDANGGVPPKVLDPFAGGGAIPLEALRLGCETYAMDLNPVATLILKATLEYPQKYGQPVKARSPKVAKEEQPLTLLETEMLVNPLVEDVKRWGQWVLDEARNEIGRFYPNEGDGSIPVGYLWARTVKCQNPSCGVEIPLMRQFWLAKKSNKKIALKMVVNRCRRGIPSPTNNRRKDSPPTITFEVVEGKAIDFDPAGGTISRANVVCPVCSAGIDANTVRREAYEGRMGQRMVAVILHHPERTGKSYRIAAEQDVQVFKQAGAYLEEKIQKWPWDFNPVPDEKMPPKDTLGFRVQRYGLLKWGDLFNPRQKLALITFVEKVRRAHEKMLEEGIDRDYAKAMVTYLALALDMSGAFCNSLARWENTSEAIKHTFSRQALPMIWDYAELNSFSASTGSLETGGEYYLKVVQFCSKASPIFAKIAQSTATSILYPDNDFDAVITDPPYYDNVPYSDLSDFFYVWLKRAVGDVYPELFSTPLTPKSQEIVQNPARHQGDQKKAKQFFEEMLTKAFQEIHRVLKPEGIAVIVFAHKSTDAWETVINSLLKSGLVLTACWPLHTEMKTRLRAKESAAMASSFYMVCRKRIKEETAYFNEIKPQIQERIREKLAQFWNEGIGGADFFISAIGPAVEVFGQYARVEKLSGEEVTAAELLQHVRQMVSEYALERILKSPHLGGVDTETCFYLLWRWTYNSAKVLFDDARKLAQAVGIELSDYWDNGAFIQKDKEFISVLGPRERKKDQAFRKGMARLVPDPEQPSLFPEVEYTKNGRGPSMIDVLHQSVILWEVGDRMEIGKLLAGSGHINNPYFWQVAQAISEVLPEGDKEKQLLQGLLYGKASYQKEAADAKGKQQDLFNP